MLINNYKRENKIQIIGKKKNNQEDETCTKCLGAGTIPGKRGNHSSIFETKKCWTCNGTGKKKNH